MGSVHGGPGREGNLTDTRTVEVRVLQEEFVWGWRGQRERMKKVSMFLLIQDPLGAKQSFHQGCISDILQVRHLNHDICISSKITVMKNNEIILWFGGVITTRGTVLKGCSIRELQNH